jgi:hypothetical protein
MVNKRKCHKKKLHLSCIASFWCPKEIRVKSMEFVQRTKLVFHFKNTFKEIIDIIKFQKVGPIPTFSYKMDFQNISLTIATSFQIF